MVFANDEESIVEDGSAVGLRLTLLDVPESKYSGCRSRKPCDCISSFTNLNWSWSVADSSSFEAFVPRRPKNLRFCRPLRLDDVPRISARTCRFNSSRIMLCLLLGELF